VEWEARQRTCGHDQQALAANQVFHVLEQGAIERERPPQVERRKVGLARRRVELQQLHAAARTLAAPRPDMIEAATERRHMLAQLLAAEGHLDPAARLARDGPDIDIVPGGYQHQQRLVRPQQTRCVAQRYRPCTDERRILREARGEIGVGHLQPLRHRVGLPVQRVVRGGRPLVRLRDERDQRAIDGGGLLRQVLPLAHGLAQRPAARHGARCHAGDGDTGTGTARPLRSFEGFRAQRLRRVGRGALGDVVSGDGDANVGIYNPAAAFDPAALVGRSGHRVPASEPDRVGALEGRVGLSPLALVQLELPEIVQAHRHVGMAAAQDRLANGQGVPQERGRLIVEVETVEDHAKAVEALGDQGVAGAQRLLPDGQGAARQRHGVLEAALLEHHASDVGKARCH
jgi:hypothetical protein